MINIEEYFISGVVPITESIDKIYGYVITNKSFRDTVKKGNDINEKFWNIIGRLSSMVSLCLGVPVLGESIRTLLPLSSPSEN